MDEKREYKYAQNMLFPRMYSSDPNHVAQYKAWCGGIKGRTTEFDNCGRKTKVTIPTQAENLRFFFRHLLFHIVQRYFLLPSNLLPNEFSMCILHVTLLNHCIMQGCINLFMS